MQTRQWMGAIALATAAAFAPAAIAGKADDTLNITISDRAHFMPLFTYVKNYGLSKDLNWKPHSDDWARFYLASWK